MTPMQHTANPSPAPTHANTVPQDHQILPHPEDPATRAAVSTSLAPCLRFGLLGLQSAESSATTHAGLVWTITSFSWKTRVRTAPARERTHGANLPGSRRIRGRTITAAATTPTRQTTLMRATTRTTTAVAATATTVSASRTATAATAAQG